MAKLMKLLNDALPQAPFDKRKQQIEGALLKRNWDGKVMKSYPAWSCGSAC